MHFGSLVAAAASYLDALVQDGEWLVRMEDLDKPREEPGAADAILRDLQSFGFDWREPVMYQSTRSHAYRAALDALCAAGAAYPCGCSRQELGDTGRYPGTCREGLPPGKQARSWRVRVPDGPIVFDDRWLGRQSFNLWESSGDFVVMRADGIFAYQLAVVVDDAEQGITDVVRGADLLDSTPRQIWLQKLLGWSLPRYLHVPVALNERGEKLSKQTRAPALDLTRAPQLLREALGFLGIHPPHGLDSAGDVWSWARENRTRFCHPQWSSPRESS